MPVLTPEEREALFTHNLSKDIVRVALAGFLTAGLEHHLQTRISTALVAHLLNNYVEALDDKDTFQQSEDLYAAGFRVDRKGPIQ